MRKIMVFLSAVLMAVSMAACSGGGDNAETAVSGYLDALKAYDLEKSNSYLVEGDEAYNMLAESGEEIKEEEKIVMKYLSYAIKGSEENGDTAVITVDITNVNMQDVLKAYMAEGLAAAFENPEMTEEEMMQMLVDAFEANKDNTVTTTVDINLTKADGSWKVQTDDALFSALMGGMSADLFNQ